MPTYDEYLYISECAQTIYLKEMLLLTVVYALSNYIGCMYSYHPMMLNHANTPPDVVCTIAQHIF
jgi:hypothetical protein